jgi:dTDP-4-amino-4,6-dideoxygalactose transaminase
MTVADVATVPFLDLSTATEPVREQVLAAWGDVLTTSSFINGAPVRAFEERFAARCGTEHAVGTANGTDALHLTFRALGLGPGDEVVVPANTFVATAEAVVLAGATPRFADVDPHTLLLTPATIRAVVTPRTRAVVAVHLYGQMPDMGAVLATTEQLGLLLVEDAAQAQGATWAGRPAGSFGVAGCFSFYPGKNLGAFGDAGAVVTHDAALAETLRSMRDHGRAAGGHHDHTVLGTNSRLDTLQAIVLDAKLPLLAGWNDERAALVSRYRAGIDPSSVRLVTELPDCRGAHHLAVVRVAERDRVRRELADRGVGTGIHYPTPCHLMAPFAPFGTASLPGAERAAKEVMSLPLYPGMREDQADRVIELVNALAAQGGVR